MALLTGCGTSKAAIEAAARKAAAEQAQRNAESTRQARDLIREASKPLPAECSKRVRAGVTSADLADGWRTAVKYERALVRSNNRLQNCAKLQNDQSERVRDVADALLAEAEGVAKPAPEDLPAE